MKKVKIYYDKYGRIYASWNKRNDLLLGEVEVGDTFKILYDDTDCDGCIKRTSFEGSLDDEGFLRDFTSKCFKDEVDGMYPDDDNIDIKYYVIECKVVEVNDTLDIESVGDYKWSMTYSRK